MWKKASICFSDLGKATTHTYVVPKKGTEKHRELKVNPIQLQYLKKVYFDSVCLSKCVKEKERYLWGTFPRSQSLK